MCDPARLETSSLGERGTLIGAVRRSLDDVETRLPDGLQRVA
jgi:hypothetical protein